MKKYTNPKMEISNFQISNILTDSGWVDGLSDAQFSGDKVSIKYNLFTEVEDILL